VSAPASPSKRAILFAYYYLPENTSGVQRACRIARYLPENGYQTHVICSSHQGADPSLRFVRHVPDDTSKAGGAGRVQRWYELLQRILPYDERLPWVPHAVQAARELLSQGPVDAVISTSPPVASHLAAWRLKRKHPDLTWMADFRDPILGNPGRARGWPDPYDRWLQESIFSAADAVVAVTDAVAEKWRGDYPRLASKIHVVWNGFDPGDGFRALPLPPRSHRVLLHAGVLYWQRHPTNVLLSLDRLMSAGRIDPSSVRLRFLGTVQKWEDLAALPPVQRLMEKGCIELIPKVPREEAMREIATADMLFLIDITNNENLGYTVPAKIFDYLLTGRPLLAITSPDGPVQRILDGSGVPQVSVYHQDSPEQVDAKLMQFFSLPSTPVTPSRWFFETFDGQRQAASIAALLDNLKK